MSDSAMLPPRVTLANLLQVLTQAESETTCDFDAWMQVTDWYLSQSYITHTPVLVWANDTRSWIEE